MIAQPHFDDERTVSRARPVVPLEALDDRVKHRRRWFLGGAFAVAIFLGAASALVSAYFKMRDLPDPEIESLSALSVPEPTPEIPTVAVISSRPKPRLRTEDEADRSTTQASPSAEPLMQPRLSERDTLRRIRDAVMVDQWEEQRARRVERRDRRHWQHRDRGLSNINEIFEGPRHP